MNTSIESVSASTAKSPVPAPAAAARYALDPTHTNVTFSVRHLMISNVRGEFRAVSGAVTFDPLQPAATTMSITVEVASIHTRDEQRDAHLRSADFFDVEKYPSITFVSKRAISAPDGLELVGDLTIHGTTREVKLAVEDISPERSDPWGNVRIGATAKTRIRRSDFGMTWNTALEAGGFVVGDEIKIEIDGELIKQA